MPILYHFPLSPFSRRTRLSLVHRGIQVTLRDARTDASLLEEARRKSAIKTIPILAFEDGSVLADSTSISHWADRAGAKGPPVWPTERVAFLHAAHVASLVDVALNTLIDTGTRYFALHDHPRWDEVKRETADRASRALGALSELARSPYFGGERWGGADMWLFTMVAWLEGLPARASSAPNIAQIVSLGVELPESLRRWADPHRVRPDVQALDTP